MIDYSTMPVIPGGPADIRHVADVIACAFDPLAATHWLVPDADRRRSVIAAYMRLHVADAAVQGVIEMTEDRAAAAVWMTVDDSVPPAGDDYADQLRDACGPYTANFEDLEATFAEHHPSGKRHHYLAFLAAMPRTQGRGAGTALLRHHFQTYPDWDAYLEASSIESARLYRRHGFEEIGPFVVGGGPTFWPMWRPASS